MSKQAVAALLVVLVLSSCSTPPHAPGRPDAAAPAAAAGAAAPFGIEVVDADTGRGVPLVELRTTNDICFYTDSSGLVAFREPGLMGTRVHFTVSSPGYEFAPDGFGTRGVTLETR